MATPSEGLLEYAALASGIALVAVWVGYPAVVAALSRFVSATGSPVRGRDPTVSVVIATRDGADAIRVRVRDCLSQDYDRAKLQVVVALDQRGGVHAADLEDLRSSEVAVVMGDMPGGKAATLNAAVRATTGEILVFTDTHQRFDADAVRHLVNALNVPTVGVASGSLVIPGRPGQWTIVSRYWLFERWLRRSEAQLHSCIGVSGSIYAMRRELWSPLPNNLVLDDVYVPMKAVLAGWRVAFVERARASEQREHSAIAEYRRKVRTLTGVIQLCAWLPEVLLPVRNPVWLQFLFHKVLRLFTPYWMALVLIWSLPTAVRLLGGSLPAALALATALVLWTVWSRGPWSSRVRRFAVEAVLIHLAVVIAGYNGLRGRWHVWHR